MRDGQVIPMAMTIGAWVERNLRQPGRITIDCGPDQWYLGRWTLPPGRRTISGCPDSSFGPVSRAEAEAALRAAGLPIR